MPHIDLYAIYGLDRRQPPEALAAALTAQLKGKKTLTKSVQAKAGTNTLTMKVPKSLKPGKYTLRLLSGGASLTSTRVKVTR